MGSTVELPRWLVAGGGLLLVGTLTTTAFLLGRTTAPPSTVLPSAPQPQPQSAVLPPPETDDLPADPTPMAEPPTEVAASTPKSPAAAPASTARAPAEATPAPVAAETPSGSAAVQSYFSALDRVGGLDPAGIDPNVLVQQAMSGDVSGLDRLIEDHRGRQAAIARIRPPAPCAEHHAKLVTLASEGLSVMQKLRSGIATGNVQALMGLQPAAMRLQSLGDEVSRLEARLRVQHGAG